MGQIILVTGASSGFGRMIATDLAAAGHTAYASMRGTAKKNAKTVADIAATATDRASNCALSSSTCSTTPRSGRRWARSCASMAVST